MRLAAFVAINARNLLTFGLTYFVNDWLAKDGALNVFNVLGSTFSKSTTLAMLRNVEFLADKLQLLSFC